jgi:uncharacterized membrane protein YkoI
MTNTENTNQTTPTTTTAPIERQPSRKAWWIAGAGIGLAVILGATALGVSVADAAEGDDHESSQVGEPGPVVGQGNQDDRDDSGQDDTDQPDADDTATQGDDSSTDPSDAAISDADREQASGAALAEVGDGTVTDVDRSDDADHAWEVEVLLADGTDVDVELDAGFAVVRVDTDN